MNNKHIVNTGHTTSNGIRCKLAAIREDFIEILSYSEAGLFPPVSLIDRAHQNLEDYLTSLAQRENSLKISFANVHVDTGAPADIADMICAVPGAVSALMSLGLRKIISSDDDGVDAEAISWLNSERYITEISNEPHSLHPLFALTDRGWRCFRDRSLRNQLSEKSGVIMMPASLASEADAWDLVMLNRARRLRQYYLTTGRGASYLLFPIPAAPRLLMGCEISDNSNISYSVAWIMDELTCDEELDALQTFLASGQVDELTLLLDRQQQIEQVQERISRIKCGKTTLLYWASEDFHE